MEMGHFAPPRCNWRSRSYRANTEKVSPCPELLRYGSEAHPLYDTWLFAVYAVPDTKAGAEHAGNVKPVPPAATRAFLAARSKRLFTAIY